MLTVWGITGLAIVLLAVATWRANVRPAIRAALTVAASISLGYPLTGSTWTLVLLALDVILVVATWRLAQHMATVWGIVWMGLLVLILVIAKLTQQQGTIPLAGPAAWIGISYFM